VGVLPKELEERLAKASAYAELIGYVASITLKVTALQAINRRMSFFQEGLERFAQRHPTSLLCCCPTALRASSTRPDYSMHAWDTWCCWASLTDVVLHACRCAATDTYCACMLTFSLLVNRMILSNSLLCAPADKHMQQHMRQSDWRW
jgi:hypothetical protein